MPAYQRLVADDAAGRRADERLVVHAHALQIEAIGEGVESEQQRDFLRRAGCDFMQGFLIGPPPDADSAAKDYI